MTYPATLEVATKDKIANWRPIGHFLMAIPHFIILYVFEAVSVAVAVISWFSIVFTGSVPVGLYNFQAMIIRYGMRVSAYVGFLHEEYPPFDFTASASDSLGTPVSVDFVPELQDRNRLTVGLRFLWAIPIILFFMVVGIAAFFVWIAAFFAVLFTGTWPQGMRDFLVKVLKLNLKVEAYVLLLTDEYPPYSLDD